MSRAPGGPAPVALLTRVRVRRALHVHRRVTGLIEGHYRSIHRARSVEIDDLREYVPGDDVRDIDWKASARGQHVLVRRHEATRQHDVVLVIDTGRAMAGLSDAESSKAEVAVHVAGEIGQLATGHGDRVGLIAGPVAGGPRHGAGRFQHLPPGTGDAHLERVLRTVHRAIERGGPPADLPGLLTAAARRLRRRATVVVVTDEAPLTTTTVALLRSLRIRHEVLVCTIGDVVITDLAGGTQVGSVRPAGELPAYLRHRADLADQLRHLAVDRHRARRAELAPLRVASTTVRGVDGVAAGLAELLAAHRHVGS